MPAIYYKKVFWTTLSTRALQIKTPTNQKYNTELGNQPVQEKTKAATASKCIYQELVSGRATTWLVYSNPELLPGNARKNMTHIARGVGRVIS